MSDTRKALSQANAEVSQVKAAQRRLEYQTQYYVELYTVYRNALERIAEIVKEESDWIGEAGDLILHEVRSAGIVAD